MSASNNHLHSEESIWQKNIFCWDAVQMLQRLVLIHGTACNADSQRSESQFECVWDVFTGHVGAAVCPRQDVLVLAWWCKTVINVCSLSSSTFSPTLSPNWLLCSLPLNNSPLLPSLSLLTSIFLHLLLFPFWFFFCIPRASYLFFIFLCLSSLSYRRLSWGWHQHFTSISSPPW